VWYTHRLGAITLRSPGQSPSNSGEIPVRPALPSRGSGVRKSFLDRGAPLSSSLPPLPPGTPSLSLSQLCFAPRTGHNSRRNASTGQSSLVQSSNEPPQVTSPTADSGYVVLSRQARSVTRRACRVRCLISSTAWRTESSRYLRYPAFVSSCRGRQAATPRRQPPPGRPVLSLARAVRFPCRSLVVPTTAQ
jgi:hypothetical protein